MLHPFADDKPLVTLYLHFLAFEGIFALHGVSDRDNLRVEKTREALELSMQAISEIAWIVGYQDEGAFRKVFRRITGLAPGDYRRRLGIAVEAHSFQPHS